MSKIAVVTGASRGIGRQTAALLAKQGYFVAVNYNKSEAEAASLVREIEAFGGRAFSVRADVTDMNEVNIMTDKVHSVFGSVDLLVNNAGVALPQSLFTDCTEAERDRVFGVNVYGVMNCVKAVLPDMIHKKSGCIINVSSVWGITGGSCEVVYSASKAAVIGFTKALAKELAPSDIRVNCVAPGVIDTDMNAHLSREDINALSEEIPLGRTGTPEEVAELICFLASDNAKYITGQTVSADGGMIM